MNVNFSRFNWLVLCAFLALTPRGSALVNTSDPVPAAESSPTAAPSDAATPPREDAKPAPTTLPPSDASPNAPAPPPGATVPGQVSPPAAPSAVVPTAPPPPQKIDEDKDRDEGESRGADDAGMGDHHARNGEPAHDVVSVFGNSVADVEVEGAVVAVLGNSTAHKNVSQAVVAVLGNSRAEGEVGQSVVAVLGNASADGHVHENIVAVLGNIDLGPHAEIDGDVVSVGGQVHVSPGAVIHGHRTMTTPIMGAGNLPFGHLSVWFEACLFEGRFLAFRHDVLWAWIPALVFLCGYIFLGLVFSTGVRRCAETLEQRPGWTILATLLTMVLTPLLLVLLLFLGFFGGVFLAIALLIASFFGKAALYAWLGRRIYRDSSALGTALAVLLGGIIFLLLFTIPIIGFLAWVAGGALGLGLVVYTLVLSMRKPAALPPATPPPGLWSIPPATNAGTPPASPLNPSAVVTAAAAPTVDTPSSTFPSISNALSAGSVPQQTASSSVSPPTPVNTSTPPTAGPAGAMIGAAIVSPGPASARPVLPVSALTLPRATFAPRLLAGLLDLVLVGFFTHLVHLGGLFLLIFSAYCVCLWVLKATTVGGIICGLKLVRLDDRPIDWSIAIIRALGAYLSLIVVGLGFLWVNFDEDCQSWHDKIAGTTIVRVPKGHSLI